MNKRQCKFCAGRGFQDGDADNTCTQCNGYGFISPAASLVAGEEDDYDDYEEYDEDYDPETSGVIVDLKTRRVELMSKQLYRKVIRVKGEDSPNVRFAQAQIRAGIRPTGEVIVPGLLPWDKYVTRRQVWDPIRQCIGLDAEFYEGAETLLYPPDWLNKAEQFASTLAYPRKGEAMGIDPAEGGDKSAWSIVDRKGLIHQRAIRTPDTTEICNITKALSKEYGVRPEMCFFDRGGGGKQHADRLRSEGWKVQTVAFGETVVPEIRHGMRLVDERKEIREEQTTFYNRRSQMYGILSELIDPSDGILFGIPAEYRELRQQLAVIPRSYDEEGKLKLPPKNKPSANSSTVTLIDLIGHSPDEADSLVLAVYGMLYKPTRPTAGIS